MKGKARVIPPFRLVNGNELSQILGVSPQRVSTLVHSGLPREPDKRYDLAQVVPWSIQRALEKGDVSGSGSARQLYFEAMTERAHLETAKLKGDLYGAAETDQFLAGLLVQLREHILSLPERVTRDRTIAADLEREITTFLADFADAVAAWAGDGGADREHPAPTAKTRRRRVGASAPKPTRGRAAAGKVSARKRAVSR